MRKRERAKKRKGERGIMITKERREETGTRGATKGKEGRKEKDGD